MRKVKQSLTLLEMTIALFLTGILLSTLWGMYHHLSVSYQQAQKQQINVHKLLFLKEKLDQVAFLVANSELSHEEESLLFTPYKTSEGHPTLCLSYDHGADPEPDFNGFVTSLLYVNSSKALCFASWSLTGQMRVETLLDHVESLTFSYFDPQTNLWRNNWPETFDHLPLWVSLQLEAKEPLKILLRVSSSQEPILYLESIQGDL